MRERPINKQGLNSDAENEKRKERKKNNKKIGEEAEGKEKRKTRKKKLKKLGIDNSAYEVV